MSTGTYKSSTASPLHYLHLPKSRVSVEWSGSEILTLEDALSVVSKELYKTKALFYIY